MIAVVDYGIGNLRSAEKALHRTGSDAMLVDDPDRVVEADAVVLPGVGHFGRCAQALRETGLAAAVMDVLDRGVPFLGICVGFQLLFEGSEEDPKATGLGVFDGVVRALPESVKRPQIQWNRLVRTDTPARMFEGLGDEPWLYFVHSYAPEPTPASYNAVVATCEYGKTVVSAVERGLTWGTQFHPEKSSRTGIALLANFARAVSDRALSGPIAS
ncbi:MAG: imidazole glycerol phosphate synthase subunit HisH [Acidimicrobiales bacterium]